MYIDTGSSVPGVPSKSRDLVDENNKIVTEWKGFETTVLPYVDPPEKDPMNHVHILRIVRE